MSFPSREFNSTVNRPVRTTAKHRRVERGRILRPRTTDRLEDCSVRSGSDPIMHRIERSPILKECEWKPGETAVGLACEENYRLRPRAPPKVRDHVPALDKYDLLMEAGAPA